ncbi:MAG: MBL fold metallo-hydrolase [Chlamydiales bacterium]|nr:MBL fold metallo-hydrolase [Chlamydiales bacterium]
MIMRKKNRYSLSDHCDGKSFFNVCGMVRHLKEGLKWWLSGKHPNQWPKHIARKKSKFTPVSKDHYHVTFIGHSTVLLQCGGLNILTDPIWSKSCSPIISKKLQRVTSPGLSLEDVPPIDLILLSHNHYDHCDVRTLKYFRKRDNPKIITGMGNKNRLKRLQFQEIWELDWWQCVTLEDKLKITFVPAQHFSGRWPFDYNKTLWGGFVIEGIAGKTKTIYFAADTGYSPHFLEIKKVFGPIDLALLPIGAYKPKSLMQLVHMSPEDAVQAHIDLEAKMSVAIHFGCFHLSDEAYDEPVVALQRSLLEHNIAPSSFLILEEGEGRLLYTQTSSKTNS